MQTILAACVALSALGFTASQSHAQVIVQTPGDPYWRTHHDSEWRERRDFREAENNRPEWLRDHCIRDWSGAAYCRR